MIILKTFIIGFIAAALPGAVQTTVFQSSITGQIKNSLKFALGAAFMDGLYLSLAYFGLVKFITEINWLKTTLSILGAFYIGYTAIISLKSKEGKITNKKTFWQGILMVVLHIPTLLYFISIAGTVFLNQPTTVTVILSSLFLFLGAMSCFLLVGILGKLINKLSGKSLIKILQTGSSILLLFFAIKLLLDSLR